MTLTLPRRSPPLSPRTRFVLIAGCALLVLLLLSGCDASPVSSNAGLCASGHCTPPLGPIENPSQGVDWWKKWLYEGVGGIFAQIAVSIVSVGISIFWTIIQTWGSPDFTRGTLNGASNGPAHLVQTALSIEQELAQGAYGLAAGILMWRTLVSYFLAPLMTGRGENFIRYTMRVIFAAVGILYLPNIVTFFIGMSDSLFLAILGDTTTLNNLSSASVGNITKIMTNFNANPGIGFVGLLLAVVESGLWVVFGLLWFLRLILLCLVFSLGPLAIITGTTEEFGEWFGKWRGHMLALFAAPLPAAIVIRFGADIAATGGSQTPTNYADIGPALLQAVEVIIILGVATKLMLDIAGPVGTSVLSYAQRAIGTAITVAAGAATGGAGAAGAGGAGTGNAAGASKGASAAGKAGASATPSGGSQSGAARRESAGGAPARPRDGESAGGAAARYGESGASFTPMLQTMRGLNSTMQTLAYGRGSTSTGSGGGSTSTGSGGGSEGRSAATSVSHASGQATPPAPPPAAARSPQSGGSDTYSEGRSHARRTPAENAVTVLGGFVPHVKADSYSNQWRSTGSPKHTLGDGGRDL